MNTKEKLAWTNRHLKGIKNSKRQTPGNPEPGMVKRGWLKIKEVALYKVW